MVQWQIEIADGLGVHHLNPGDPAPEGCVRLNKVEIRLPEKGNSTSHGARPVC